MTLLRIIQKFIFCLIIFQFSGCGYHFGSGALPTNYSTFYIPYIKGDEEGLLTADVIKQMSRAGGLKFQTAGADLTILVELVDLRDENIGFRYDRNRQGKLTKSIIPAETRITAFAKVTVLDGLSGEVLLGPARLSASVDFDHDYYSSRNEINVFSLGQLDDYDAAHDVVFRPLYIALAKKIVDYVCDSW